MPVDLYLMTMSAPCRSVRMTLKHLNIEHNLKITNLFSQEHLTPEYLAINPTHTIPTIVDGDYSLWESRAIMTYLANKYAPDSDIYPKCPKARAEVDKILYFDIGTLYKALGDVIYPIFLKGATTIDPEADKTFRGKLDFLEGFLSKKPYVAADHLTLADFAIYSSISFVDVIDYDLSAYPNILAWRTRIEQLPYNKEVNTDPLVEAKAYLASKRAEAAKGQ